LAIVSSAANADVALGADEEQVRVIEIATGQQLATVARGCQIQSVAFSPDGQRLATAGKLGVDMWDWKEKPQQNARAFKPFVVHLKAGPFANLEGPLARIAARKVRIGEFTDARPRMILGERQAAFKVKTGDILCATSPSQEVRKAIVQL